MTFSDMQAAVSQVLEEYRKQTSRFYPPGSSDIKDAINEGVHQMTDDTEWYLKSIQLGLVQDVTYYDLSSLLGGDFLSMRAVFNRQTGRWLQGIDWMDLDDSYARWEAVYGQPQFFFLRGLWVMGVFPKRAPSPVSAFSSMRIDEFSLPHGYWTAADRLRFASVGFGGLGSVSAEALDVWYAADFPDLVNASDTLTNLPTEFHHAPVEYAVYDLLLQAKKVTKATLHWSNYQDLVFGNPKRREDRGGLKGWVNQQAMAGGVGVFGEAAYGSMPTTPPPPWRAGDNR